jgi:hypothetical protein
MITRQRVDITTAAAAPGPQGRAGTAGHPVLQAAAPGHESVNDTFKGQLDLERHSGHTSAGVMIRALQRILALTAAIWHNGRAADPSSAHWSDMTTEPFA